MDEKEGYRVEEAMRILKKKVDRFKYFIVSY